MSRRIEWRVEAPERDALVAVEEDANVVVHAWPADAALLAAFLNDMDGLLTQTGDGAEVERRDPAEWGQLVISRSEGGDILYVDPERYWDGIATVFRSHGSDPHPWRGHA